MRTYDVYRHTDLTARVRVLDNGKIEWAYRQEPGNGHGFWGNNDNKRRIEQYITRYPVLEELVLSEFTLLRAGT
jgi:hypothetical protein